MVLSSLGANYTITGGTSYSHYAEYSHLGSAGNTYSIRVPSGQVAFVEVVQGSYQDEHADRSTLRFRMYENGVSFIPWTLSDKKYYTTFSSDGTIGFETHVGPSSYRQTIYGQNSLGPIILGHKDIYYSSYYTRQYYTLKVSYESSSSKCLVSFETDGGTRCQARLYSPGGQYSSFPETTKHGYTFGGWYSDVARTKQVKPTDTVSSSVTKLYAKWGKTPTLSSLYITGDPSVPSGGKAQYTCTAVMSDESETTVSPTWELTSGGTDYASISSSGVLSAKNTTVDRTVTIRADWSKKVDGAVNSRIALKQVTIKAGGEMVTVSFSTDGGSSVYSRQYEVGGKYGSFPSTSKKGYRFDGWFTSSSHTTEVFENTTVSASVRTLYAKWTLETYEISFNQQKGTGGSTTATVHYGDPMPRITLPVREGYRFAGYFTSPNGKGEQYYDSDGNGLKTWDRSYSASLHAKWDEPVPVSLSIAGDDTVPSGGSCTYTCMGTMDNGTTCKVFPEWSLVSGGEHASIGFSSGVLNAFGTLIPRDVTLRAECRYDGGSVRAEKVVTIEKSPLSANISTATAAARWPWNGIIDVDYTVTLEPDGAKAAIRVEGYDQSKRRDLEAVSVSGTLQVSASGTYRLSWDVGNDYPGFNTDAFVVDIIPRCLIPILFDSHGGTACSLREFVEGEPYGPLPTTTRTGYTFAGWYADSAFSVPVTPDTIVKGSDTKLHAKWTGNTYAVTFDKRGGVGGTSGTTATYGTAMPGIAIPSLKGHSFEGYYTAPEGGGTQYYTGMGTSARPWAEDGTAILYAKWEPLTYGLTLDRQGGGGGKTNVVATFGAPMPTITCPARAGHTFGGYFSSPGGAGTQYYAGDGTSVHIWDQDDTAVLYALWTPRTYDISLDKQGGTGGPDSLTVTYGDRMPDIAPPTRPYYQFMGYYASTNGNGTQYYSASGESAATCNFTRNTTLYAHWKHDGTAPYLVIDLSGGTNAVSYPVTCLADVPAGGWSGLYKMTNLVLRRISAGTFMMGCPSTEIEYDKHQALHQVTLTKAFYIGVFELTQKQYFLVMGVNPSKYKGDARPVENVSWNTIRGLSSTYDWPTAGHAVSSNSFMGKLRAKTGLMFDLPTDAQWEYACRAGTTTPFNNGGTITSSSFGTNSYMALVGRYRYNSSDGKGGYNGYHTTVGSYAPNNWGIYDMHGNVGEWCLDWRTYPEVGVAVIDPEGQPSGGTLIRTIRGGAAGNGAVACTATYWSSNYPQGYLENTGFRVCCLLPE